MTFRYRDSWRPTGRKGSIGLQKDQNPRQCSCNVRVGGARARGLPFVLAALWGWMGACGPSDERPPPMPPVVSVPVCGTFEAVLDLPVEADNPFDPDQVRVEVAFEGPGGQTFTVPAFVARPYDRTLVDGTERLTPAGGLAWRVRFSPTGAGRWRWRWEADRAGETTRSCWLAFEAGGSRAGSCAPLRVSEADSRYLCGADGTPFLAVGENLGWYDGRGTFAYDDWLEKLAAQGANYIRLWMPSWAFGLEWIERDGQGRVARSSLGNYTDRLGRAWQLDHVMERARDLGLRVMLCLQNHGPFSLQSNSEWVDNPYNAANGGPLGEPVEVFTDPEALSLFERRLRYIVARWGYAPNLLAWELWNEVDLVEGAALEDVVAWHRRMGRLLEALDPRDRLITTSVGAVPAILDFLLGTTLYGPLWELPEIDIVQLHLYTLGEIGVDFAAVFPLIVEGLRGFGKPVLIAEAGVDYRGPAETLRADPEAIGFHDMLWAGLFSESMGTGMTWWWDNVIDPEDLYFHFGPVAAFTRDVPFHRQGFESGGILAVAPAKDLVAFCLRGETVTLAWVKNAAHQWFHPEPSAVAEAVVRITGLPEGGWSARWLDAYTGGTVAGESVDVRQGGAELQAPVFARDIALRLDRLAGP